MKKFLSMAGISLAGVMLTSGLMAQDQGTLDLLVKKGIITQTERDQMVATKSGQPTSVTSPSSGTKLVVSGYLQVQYNYLHVDGGDVNPDPSDVNGFEIRRALVDFSAKMENGWGAYVTFVSDATYRTRDYLERAAITYTDSDYGCFTGGYRKVHFAAEEYSSAAELPAIERSIVTNYFTTGTANGGPNITDRRTGFANRHVGLYWDGKFGSTEPFECGLAVTNAYTDSIQYASEFNDKVSLWAYAQQTFRPTGGAVLTAGLNFGWQPTDNTAVIPGESADMLGWNPFITAKLGGATFLAEYIGSWIHDGRNDGLGGSENAMPWGANVVATYRIGAFEPALRYSYLSGDGRGIPMAVWRWNRTPNEGLYDEAWTLFAGVHVYFMNDTVKLSVGYEHGRFEQSPKGAAYNRASTGDGVRVQLQAVF